jgi:DNA polymerase II large subunit
MNEITANNNIVVVSEDMQKYFTALQENITTCYKLAEKARSKGLDPETNVEILQALDLASRVEQLVGPQEIATKIRETTKKLGDRELVSIEIAKDIVKGKNYKFAKVEDAIDQAIRTGLAILTEGVLVAPLEGIAEVKLGSNKDGSKYVDLYFSGPIRSAGGTGQAMSVLIADIVRRELGIEKYQPTRGEIERYKEEIPLYKRVQHLQYVPTPQEIESITSNCPICINGEGTENEEVTGYRDLPRIGTNRLRGGACLVIAEGLCLKAPKILKYVSKLKLRGWEFLDIFVNKKEKTDEMLSITPSTKYLEDVIAGRPVLSYPSRKGGFRLRYGRARTCGLASTAINPATMFLLDEFITIGTQMKTERPGKGTIGTPCDQIAGPIVMLQNGDLIQVNTVEKAINIRQNISTIVDLGEILIPFGEFIENNVLLSDASYVYEWWIQDLQQVLNILPKECTFNAINEADLKTNKIVSKELGRDINLKEPSPYDAFELSDKYKLCLHPNYTLFWHDIAHADLVKLAKYIKENGRVNKDETLVLTLPKNDEIKRVLVELGALHKQRNDKMIFEQFAYPLIRCCGLETKDGTIIETQRYNLINKTTTSCIIPLTSKLAGVKIHARAPSRIGTRMGRPEKASPRKMKPPPHVLFPVGNYGGMQRLVKTAAEKGKIEIEAGIRRCPNCNKTTYKTICGCGARTVANKGRIVTHKINMADELAAAQKRINEPNLPEIIKGVIGMISENKTPEPLEKGILRAKHKVYVFKDGTIRFDMTDAPLTHFKPKEINTSIEKLKELGYTKDYLGNPLEDVNQICELKVQDVIISNSCRDYFTNVANFVDDLLSKFYKLKTFYNISKKDDLVGHLAIGLAPHTSAGAVARIIGFTNAQVCFAHPFYHAAKRRNCDGDEDGLMLLMDAILNFSHTYIPNKRGGKMDLPLIMTTRIDPAEVDKEAHNVDVSSRYPLAFYEATIRHEDPKELDSLMELVASRIGTKTQYEGFGFTHDTDNIAEGPPISSYKTLKSMIDKIDAQLGLAAKIRAVEEADVAYKVIERHFLPDILGNLRAFSKQSIRCPSCNTIYRRIPLQGTCLKCGGKLTLTVHEKSIKKYLEISKEIARKYNLPNYACQRIDLVEKSIDSLFGNDKVKVTKLSDFV